MKNLPISNHHIVHVNYFTVLLVNYALLKPETIKVDSKYVIQNVCEFISKMVYRGKIKLVHM